MKEGKLFTKLIVFVLAAMVVSYVIYNMIHAMSSGVRTTQAVLYSTTEGMGTEGFLVRREAALPADFQLILPVRAEGEKVAAGTEVALSLRSTKAQERQLRINQVEEGISQLQQAIAYQSQLTDNAAVTAKIDETAADFAAQISRGRLEAARSTGQSLKALILRRELGTDDTLALQRQIGELQTELLQLQKVAAGDSASVRVDRAGYYSSIADGYEQILTPESIHEMSVDGFRSLWEDDRGPGTGGFTAGRLIESCEWYYAALVRTELLKGIETDDVLRVSLGGDLDEELEMTVTRIENQGDESLLVLYCDRRLSDISALRRMKATIVFHSYSGLRVPKEAVLYAGEDGGPGVYILENGKALWKDVQILYDLGDAYIVELDKTSTYNLWPGDLILPDTEGLFDGKVVS